MKEILLASNAGIECSADQLTKGNCTFKPYETLSIRQGKDSSPDNFISDAVFGFTVFIGTVVTIGLVFSGIMLIMAGGDEGLATKGKNGIKYSIIGLLLVVFSYAIIRLVQEFVKG